MKYEPVFKLPYSNVFLSDLIFQSSYKDFDTIINNLRNRKYEEDIKTQIIENLNLVNKIIKKIHTRRN